ncbi:molybdopterin molybdotransferase MoeA [Streptomyces sp. KL118A]|uniref:molybdopterin molybdotransferase MoeA n=1 Tax=Streptomyces sp. KL118A TaxID=3045153 RepID=UPI00278BAE6C|nr:molybdopterin molybdotransferase MoeA [Streptomyces sp. KL118A]
MTGQPASDAELDEALALVNGHRDAHDDPAHRPTSGSAPPPSPASRPSPPSPASPAEPSTPASAPAKDKHRDITPWPAARARAQRAAPGPGTEPVTVPLHRALGLILAAPLAALTDLPSFDTSAMDGWVVAGPGPWDVRADGILAGHARPDALSDGEAVRIATGARIPQDATAVLRSEHGRTDDKGRLHALREMVTGQDIRPRAQECRSGDQLMPAGALVTPAVLGLAAAAGYDALPVFRRPRAEVLVLGDELLTEGLPREGLIRDALGPMLPPWLHALGAEVTAVRRLGDDAEALHDAITSSTADLIVTTGGTASGPVDHVHPTLRRIGAELLVDGVAVRPGHPMLLARIRPDRHLVGLPGNPLAAVSGLLTLAEPLLRTLSGRAAGCGGPATYTAPLRDSVQGHPHDTRLVPVALRAERAVPLHFNGPAMLRGIAAADGLAVVPPGGAREGRELEVLDLPWAVPEVGTGTGAGTALYGGAIDGGQAEEHAGFTAGAGAGAGTGAGAGPEAGAGPGDGAVVDGEERFT